MGRLLLIVLTVAILVSLPLFAAEKKAVTLKTFEILEVRFKGKDGILFRVKDEKGAEIERAKKTTRDEIEALKWYLDVEQWELQGCKFEGPDLEAAIERIVKWRDNMTPLDKVANVLAMRAKRKISCYMHEKCRLTEAHFSGKTALSPELLAAANARLSVITEDAIQLVPIPRDGITDLPTKTEHFAVLGYMVRGKEKPEYIVIVQLDNDVPMLYRDAP